MLRSSGSQYLDHPAYPENENVYVVEDKASLLEVARGAVRSSERNEDWDESFFVGDIGCLFSRLKKFQSLFPQVQPFYAVSSNPFQPVIRTLAALGTGFSCVSKAEIALVLNCGAKPSRILFANPCKQFSHICYARDNDVKLMTVDNEEELKKMKVHFPGARLLLRIMPFEKRSNQNDKKLFGATLSDAKELLKRAMDFGLDMIGLSFDRDCWTTEACKAVIDSAKFLFDFAKTLGYTFTMLDIGQGFLKPSQSIKHILNKMPPVAENALIDQFLNETGVKIIAQPGKILTQSAYWLVTNVIAKKTDRSGMMMYFVGESLFGAFNDTKWRNETAEAMRLYPSAINSTEHIAMVYGQSLAGEDIILSQTAMSEVDVGDWLVWKNMGNFDTIRPHTGFNGLLTYRSLHYINESDQKELQESCKLITLLPAFVRAS